MTDQPDKDGLRAKAELDQSIAQIADWWPRLWWSLFTGLKEAGFDDDQAMELVKTYVSSTFRKGGN